MPGRDIVVVGFSAGGIAPLLQLVAELTPDFPATIFVVHHFPAQSISALPSILNRAGPLHAAQPADGEGFVPGRIYVARPDRHLVIRDGRVRLTTGPREHGHRPAIDPLFRSAARTWGPRVVGVILSGTLDDGTSGLLEVKNAGGLAVVQEPTSAAYPGMPASAIAHVAVDHIVASSDLGELVNRLVRGPERARGLERTSDRQDGAAREAEHGSNLIRETLLKRPVREALDAPAEPADTDEGSTGSGAR